MPQIRPLNQGDRPALLELWYQGWHDAHAQVVPPGILAYRTLDYFSLWLEQSDDEVHAMIDNDHLLGFVSVKGREIVKLYVGSASRGKGIAKSLLSYGERLLAQHGHDSAELFCTVGNVRAQKFYAREGWSLSRIFPDNLWLPNGNKSERFLVQTQHYTKQLNFTRNSG